MACMTSPNQNSISTLAFLHQDGRGNTFYPREIDGQIRQFVMADRVLIAHSVYGEYPTRAQLILNSHKEDSFNQKLNFTSESVLWRKRASRQSFSSMCQRSSKAIKLDHEKKLFRMLYLT